MDWLKKIIRPEILNMKGYSSARNEFSSMNKPLIMLNANENPFNFHGENPISESINRYPTPQPPELINRLAKLYKAETGQIFVGRGMDEVIDLLIKIFCTPYKDNIIYCPPTFDYYRIAAESLGINIIEAPLESANDFQLDTSKLIEKCNSHTKIIFLCTPNNPTGNVLDLSQIEIIAKQLPHTIIAVDEAYIEFSNSASAISLINRYDNIVVMRTMSKAYAFAGVRIGSLIANPEIIKYILKIMPPYPLPQPCIKIALEILEEKSLDKINEVITYIKKERKRLYHVLQGYSGIIVRNTEANFLLITVDNADKIHELLIKEGVVIRNRSNYIKDTLRITIGSIEENDQFLQALAICLQYDNK